MIALARLSIRRPRAMIAVWLVVAAVLTLIGFGVSNTLSPTVTVVPGTQSAQAQRLAEAQFGPTQLIPILLEGPKRQLSKQGPKLVIALMKRPHTRVMSAWDAGSASATMRPKAWPHAGMIVVSVDKSEKQVVQHDQPQIEQLVARTIKAPVNSYVTGQPSLDRAIKDASINNLRHTELIVVGILFLLLLIGLRAPIAALVVTAVGAVSVLAGFGEVALLGHIMHLDPLGVALGTMTGLALAVGFSLMIVDRFHREELPDDPHPRTAAAAAVRELNTTGKAVLVGGTAVVVALLLAAAIGPTELMVSLGAAMTVSATFAIGGAVVVMPAALVLLGRRLDMFSFPAPAFLARVWSRLLDGGNWVTRHAVYTSFAATVLLGAIALPAFALKTGPPDVGALPANSQARIAFQEVARVMGPGWPTPYNMIIVASGRPITTPATLASINRLQTQIAASKTVDSVTGPAAIYSTAKQLQKFGPGQVNAIKVSKKSKKDLLTLINGLGQAGAGSAQLRSGLLQAVSGANQLHGGSSQAKAGSAALHAGLAQADAGSSQLADGLNQAESGAVALKDGAAKALAGASQLAAGLGKGAPQVTAGLPAVGALASDTAAASWPDQVGSGQRAGHAELGRERPSRPRQHERR